MKVNNLSKSPSLALFFISKLCWRFLLKVASAYRKALLKQGKTFLLHFKSSFSSSDNQILTLNLNFKIQILNFQILKCHDVIKFPDMKHKTNFTE